ncbi:hypothetical protein AWZ03_011251 [Drosophila navojoa]|uniref:Frizzled/Smoothened transmembrane domain-containing protein n=1 Tax=Drosophila navojoa TaxID=7232 RepID=A0A484B0Y8_DRONA|nr:hypothetical protein AWZ03_011251 [Drosophila navojoa]
MMRVMLLLSLLADRSGNNNNNNSSNNNHSNSNTFACTIDAVNGSWARFSGWLLRLLLLLLLLQMLVAIRQCFWVDFCHPKQSPRLQLQPYEGCSALRA